MAAHFGLPRAASVCDPYDCYPYHALITTGEIRNEESCNPCLGLDLVVGLGGLRRRGPQHSVAPCVFYAIADASASASASASAGRMERPAEYRSFDDSPFKPLSFAWFHLEDFNDHALNTPGVSVSAGTRMSSTSVLVSSTRSMETTELSMVCATVVRATRCGARTRSRQLRRCRARCAARPRRACRDRGGGASTFTVEAFDANGAPLGSRQIVENDGTFGGNVGDDRFVGLVAEQGIAKIIVRGSQGRSRSTTCSMGGRGVAPPSPPPPPDGWSGPAEYRSFDDSLFKPLSFAWFHLEDFNDHVLNTPGVSVSAGTRMSSTFGAGPSFDSVDGDDRAVERC